MDCNRSEKRAAWAAECRAAAERGDARAQRELGFCYERGLGVARNASRAAEWYQKAAEQGHADAQYRLGLCRLEGRGTARDDALAAELFQKAAKQNHAPALYALSVCFAEGRGTARDEAQALRLLKGAAELGDAQAEYELGCRFAEGRGVERDVKLAAEWLRASGKQGFKSARAMLGGFLTVSFSIPGDARPLRDGDLRFFDEFCLETPALCEEDAFRQTLALILSHCRADGVVRLCGELPFLSPLPLADGFALESEKPLPMPVYVRGGEGEACRERLAALARHLRVDIVWRDGNGRKKALFPAESSGSAAFYENYFDRGRAFGAV